MLRKRIPKKRIFLRADERAMVLKLGKGLSPAIRHLITIVDYSTFRRWVRKEPPTNLKPRNRRPKISLVIREEIVQMAQDTANVAHCVGRLKALDPILSGLADKDELMIVGATYELSAGKVEVLA